MNPELHLFILWENARYQQEQILADINNHFSIQACFEITWTPQLVSSNFTRFYGVNLPQNSDKERICGSGEFLLVIVKDNNPVYDNRLTSHGLECVNTNMFDAKERYRSWTKGGHRVHGTNNPNETNHDMTLLLGINVDDFLKGKRPQFIDGNKIHADLIGTNGWADLKQMFYVLNNTIQYCVLRNHETLPDKHDPLIHGDIDLLVANRLNAKYVLNASPVYCDNRRVYHNVHVGDNIIPFDIRYVGDNYYHEKWEKDILNKAVLKDSLFYVPDPVNQYYTLLYHAYIQKAVLASDYPLKLTRAAESISVEYKNEPKSVIRQLDEFLADSGYEYTIPVDFSVFINNDNLQFSNRYQHFGLCIKYLNVEIDGKKFQSFVFKHKQSYIKKGTPWLIDNESRFLNKLKDQIIVPEVLKLGESDNEHWMAITPVPGISVSDFFANKKKNTSKIVQSYLQAAYNILKCLHNNQIIHRDFTPENQLLCFKGKSLSLGLIDFGWAIYEHEKQSCITPPGLCNQYSSPDGMSDVYSWGAFLKERWNYVWSIRKLAEYLLTNESIDYDYINKLCNRKFGIVDSCGLFMLRHRFLFRMFLFVKNKLLHPIYHFAKRINKRISRMLSFVI